MKYYSLNNKAPKVGFREAVINGLAPDRGLYFPEQIDPLPNGFIEQIPDLTDTEIAVRAISQFVGSDIPEQALYKIVDEVLQFDFPLKPIAPQISVLELFHGPTMAFKDVGARFMARCLGYFSSEEDDNITVLVATSGDTGGAVAHGFLGVEGVNVVILYPSGKVSEIQEKQLTTMGQNITALEVEGSFDDCQQMVKRAFLDEHITRHRKLTSANSINVARWLPQQFYYFIAYKKMGAFDGQLVFSVPSGNFGNICAGMVAQKLGLPIDHFIAATNINDTVPKYMESGAYRAQPSSPTISNAMDVGDPSNFVRIQKLYGDSLDRLKENLSSYSFTDEQTKLAMKELHDTSGYTADPHGAVGYLGLKEYLSQNPNASGIFLETAHPVKFLDVVEDTLKVNMSIPEQIKAILHKEKKAFRIDSYEELKHFLLAN